MLKFKVLLIFFIQGGKMNFFIFFLMQIRFFVVFLNDKDLLSCWATSLEKPHLHVLNCFDLQ